MANKGYAQQANTQAQNLSKTSTANTSSALQGGGAFGGPGLTSDYSTAQGGAQKAVSGNIDTGGYDPDILQGMRQTAAGHALTGGVDQAATDAYTKLATEGPEISSDASNAYKDVIANRGLNPLAAKTYGEFADTGGFSDADKSGFVRQATSGVKGAFDTLSSQAKRANAATGGYGGTAAVASLGRNALNTVGETTTSALNDVNAQIRANRLQGAAGLQSGTGNELAAASGLGAQDQLRMQGQLAGAGGLTDIAKLKQSGFGEQAGLEGNVASQKLGYAQLQNLMSSQAGQQILSLMGIDASDQQASMKAFQDLANQPGALDRFMQFANLAIQGGKTAAEFV